MGGGGQDGQYGYTMKRLRLQIEILPLECNATPARDRATASKDHAIRPWTQPEAAEITLEQLAEHIEARYGRIYVGNG